MTGEEPPPQGRQLPWSEEAEISVLGAMLIDGDAVGRLVELCRPRFFYKRANELLFRAMRKIHGRGDVIDVTTLARELKDRDELEQAGGMPYLAQLVAAVPTAANAEEHAEILREKEALRRIIRVSGEVQQAALEAEPGEVRSTLDVAEQKVLEVARGLDSGDYDLPKDLVMDALGEIEEEIDSGPEVVSGLPTGFRDLDSATSGLHRGDLTVIGGRPSMGKTSFALNIAAHLACEKGVPVGVFSLEMSKRALIKRLLCSEARLPYHRIRSGDVEQEEFERLSRAAGLVNQAPLPIDDQASMTVLEVRSRARRMVELEGVQAVIVDYIQYLEGAGDEENRQREIAEISRGLKALAKELNVAVIAISQLSRAPEKRDMGRPRMADLRNSGAIEQDADLILFVYRPEEYVDPKSSRWDELQGNAEIIIAKQRNGPTRTVEMHFNSEIMQFEDKSYRREAA